jgi:esterase
MELFRHTLGEGEPLVILHGLLGISDNWVTVGRSLAHHHRVIIPDLRNHGRSPHAATFNYAVMACDLEELFDSEGITSAVVLGHSMGGRLAMHLATLAPEKVERLIVADIAPGTTPVRQHHLHLLRAMKSVNFDTVKSRQEVEELLAPLIPSAPLRQFVMKNLVRVGEARLGWRLHLDAIEYHLDQIMEGLQTDRHYPGPTLFIRGGESDYLTPADLPAIAHHFPKYRLETLEGAGHWLHVEQPAEFIRLTESWLQDTQKG